MKKSVEKLGKDGYQKELQRQRTPEYKTKRNERLRRKRIKDKVVQIQNDLFKLERMLE